MPERDDRKISGHTGECSPEKILRGNGGKILAANIPPISWPEYFGFTIHEERERRLSRVPPPLGRETIYPGTTQLIYRSEVG
jgi:hypothetical protein